MPVGVARHGAQGAAGCNLSPGCSTCWSSRCWPPRWPRSSTTCPTPRCAGATPGPAASSSPSRSNWPSAGLAWYLNAVPSFSTVYGAFATLPILLLWIYLVWVIVLLGAVIAAYAPSLQMRVASIVTHLPGWRFELALTLLQAAARGAPCRPAWPVAVRDGRVAACRPAATGAGDRVAVRAGLGVSGWTRAATPAMVLLCDVANTRLKPLLDLTLLAPGEASAVFRQQAGLDRMSLAQALGGPLACGPADATASTPASGASAC
jgi:hypothetical protein